MAPVRRVVLALANGGHGGMQVQVGLLARGLRDRGVEVVVACGPGNLDVGDAEIVRLDAMRGAGTLRYARGLRALVKERGCDVLHGHGLRLAPSLVAAAGRSRALVTCHGLAPERVARTATMLRMSTIRVASCGEGPERLLRAAGVSSVVLDNAVPEMPAPMPRGEILERYGVGAPDRTLVISPIRMTEQKDPLSIVRALELTEHVDGLLIGGGPLEAEVRAAVARAGIEGRVAVGGWTSDARAMLASSDILCLASRWEGQPTTVLEAMAARVAIVATSCTGIAETVEDAHSALLAPVGQPSVLAGAIERLRADPALAERLRSNAEALIVDRSAPRVVEQHLAAYEALIEGRFDRIAQRRLTPGAGR